MRPVAIVVVGELGQCGVQVALIDHDQVIEALPPEGPHHPVGDRILIRCHHRHADAADAQPSGPIAEVGPENAIPIMEQVSRLAAGPRGVEQLLPDHATVGCSVTSEVDEFPASVRDEEEDIERFEGQRLHHEQVGRPDALQFSSQEAAPARTRWSVRPRSTVAADRAGAHY